MRTSSRTGARSHRVTIGDVPDPDPILGPLAAIVGPEHVLTEPDRRASYECDWSGRFHGTARAVVRPASTAEVAAVLAACSAEGVPVVPQGGNTGLVGGGVPRGGEILVSLRRLDAIEVEPATGAAIVGAGATLEAVQDAARRCGWAVGVDLGSRGSATIGGMVATNAGCEHVLRYGPMAAQLLGLEAVLADGTIVGRVPALRKDNTGYHWEGILPGSEGTLAVITRAHLRLVPRLPARVVALVALDDVAAAVAMGTRLRRELTALLALELCLADGIALVCAHTGLPEPFDRPAAVVLLVECAGRTGETDTLVEQLAAVLERSSEPHASAVATDAAGRAHLWRYREAHTEAVNAVGIPHKLDVTLPDGRIAEFAGAVRERVARVAPDARVVLFGHVGDGNLHVNVLGPPPEDGTADDVVLDLVLAMGGSISAEHGIGVAKRAALMRARPSPELAAERALKHALDPAGILNPGVIFTP